MSSSLGSRPTRPRRAPSSATSLIGECLSCYSRHGNIPEMGNSVENLLGCSSRLKLVPPLLMAPGTPVWLVPGGIARRAGPCAAPLCPRCGPSTSASSCRLLQAAPSRAPALRGVSLAGDGPGHPEPCSALSLPPEDLRTGSVNAAKSSFTPNVLFSSVK